VHLTSIGQMYSFQEGKVVHGLFTAEPRRPDGHHGDRSPRPL